MEKIKKFLIIAIMVFITTSSLSNAAVFTDLKGYDWAKGYIYDVNAKGIVTGYPDKTFRPGNPVTRIEAIVMASNLHDKGYVEEVYKNSISKYQTLYEKNNIPKWAWPYITFSFEQGIVPYKEEIIENYFIDNENTKKPLNALRYEVAVFLVRSLGLEGQINENAVLTYKDSNQINKYSVGHIDMLQQKGILSKKGDGRGYFNPNDSITRAETATMISKAYPLAPKNKGKNLQKEENQETRNQMKITGKLTLITYDSSGIMTVNLLEPNNKSSKFSNHRDMVEVYSKGNKLDHKDLEIGQKVNLVFQEGKMEKIEILPEESKISGILDSFSTVDWKVTLDIDGSKNTYQMSPDTKVYINDRIEEAAALQNGSRVELTMKDKKVIEIKAALDRRKIQGKVKYASNGRISIETDGKDEDYKIDQDVDYTRNGHRESDLGLIGEGDVVDATIEEGRVIKLAIKSTPNKYLSATLTSLNISYKDITLTLDYQGKEIIAKVTPDTVIRVDKKRADVSDLRVGNVMDVYTEGAVIDEIITDGSYQKEVIEGKVLGVDLMGRSIDLSTRDGIKKAYYDVDTKVEDIDGKPLEPRLIYKDDYVTAIGVLRGGDIISSRIIVDLRD